MSRRTAGLSHLLQSRIIVLSVAFTAVALVAAATSFALAEPILALLLIGSAVLLLTLAVIILHQRNAPAVAKSLRRHDAKLLEVQHLVAQAEQRCVQINNRMTQEMTAELHLHDCSERLAGIQSSLDAMVREVPARREDSPQRQAPFSERDLEMFLVHLLANRNDGVH